MVHFCQMCGSILSPKDLTGNPLHFKLFCRYCGAEYKICKNFFHYFLVLLTWLAASFILLSLHVLNLGHTVNIPAGVLVICTGIMFTLLIGKTVKIDRLNRKTRKTGTLNHV